MAKVGLPSGTRDFLPEQLIFRQKVIGIMREVFERYGFLPLETPAVERLDVLSGKYGEEADRLIFKVLKRGEELKSAVSKGEELADMGLRYDLTVPLCRVVAMHQNDLDFPFRRYQIQPVWRADKPQKGRYREFYQCDVDVVGQEAPLADAELIALTYDTLKALGFTDFVIRYNHRLLLSALAEKVGIPGNSQSAFFITLDKLEKIGLNNLEKELQSQGLSENSIKEVFSVIEVGHKSDMTLGGLQQKFEGYPQKWREGYSELLRVDDCAERLGVPRSHLRWDFSLARGLDYYTGPIFETSILGSGIGSICAGGRYDDLISVFSEGRSKIPATGTSFGLERIMDLLIQFQKIGLTVERPTRVVVVPLNESSLILNYALELLRELRLKGIKSEIHPVPQKNLKDKFSWASKRRIPFVALVGADELPVAGKEGQVVFKNMATGQQVKLPFGQLPAELKRN